jgi:hypothetical protein
MEGISLGQRPREREIWGRGILDGHKNTGLFKAFGASNGENLFDTYASFSFLSWKPHNSAACIDQE